MLRLLVLMGPAQVSELVSGQGWIRANGVELFYEQLGRKADPTVLLLMGNSLPGFAWPDGFCDRLTSCGFCVIRFDQRDTGLSTYVDFETAPYTLDDLARDALELLDALGIERAHVAGLSQGGVVAYRMALEQPERVRSLAVLMSSTDLRPKNDAFAGALVREGELPRPSADFVAQASALNAAPATSPEEVAARFVENFRLAKGARSPFDEEAWRELGRRVAAVPLLRRDGVTAAMATNSNHTRAQKASAAIEGNEMATLKQPALIIHGDGDPIFPVAHAEWAAATIPQAKLVIVPDMGHALDPAFFVPVAEALTNFWRR
jgi:pimeloyl-ACP methyl ester carboxylesterase